MRFSLPDGQIVRIDQPFNMGDVQYPSNWLRLMTPSERLEFGAVELPEPEPPVTPYVPTAFDEIRNLEALITPRRLREAVLTPEGKAWLEGIDAQISALRPPKQDVSP
ncbi:MAG: hypothetical protein FJ184_13305 [Gammaproteobacteria bacterium]|nr:hypothetical protein [Gammaproteobacteria bacterium]